MAATDHYAALARQMSAAATDFLESLAPAQRAVTLGTLKPDEHTAWTYLPGPRPGVRIGDLTSEQCELASALLVSSYGDEGAAKVERVITVEAAAWGLESVRSTGPLLTRYRDQDYWLRILGLPGSDTWAWRLSGHHLVAHATVAGRLVSTTPQFFGAQPAVVARGPHLGVRGLAEEEDLARQLVTQLAEDQQERAIVSFVAPADILSRHDPVAVLPRGLTGLPASRMDSDQQRLLEELVQHYLGRAPAAVANRAWADVHDAGQDQVTFSWAGGLRVGEGHYYAVAGPTLLIEYDNTQDSANHIHSVWRDLRHDWGGDALAQHYRSHRHS